MSSYAKRKKKRDFKCQLIVCHQTSWNEIQMGVRLEFKLEPDSESVEEWETQSMTIQHSWCRRGTRSARLWLSLGVDRE